jgi:hypothetical protein
VPAPANKSLPYLNHLILSNLFHSKIQLFATAAVVDPPKPKAAVCIPAPANLLLAVFILFGEDVQAVPL